MPQDCPNCGEPLRRGARACPECGSDERTGWRSAEDLDYEAVDLPEDVDYEDVLAQEGLAPRPATHKRAWLVLVAIALAILLAWAALR
jgi:hypothetical protein